MQNKYIKIIEQYEAYLKNDNLIFNIVGYIKILLILLECFMLYLIFYKIGFNLGIVISGVVTAVILIILWLYHIKLHEKLDYSKGIINICNNHIYRITGKWSSFKDTGDAFLDMEHPYANDLDVVGANSLFQLLNTTNTWHGRQAFVNDLLHPDYQCDELQQRQKSIAELSKDINFVCNIQYYLSDIGADDSIPKLVAELNDCTPFINNKVAKLFLAYVPVVTFILIVSMIIFQIKPLYTTGIIIVIIQTVIWLLSIQKTLYFLGSITHIPYKLRAYSKAIDILTKKSFSSEKLKQINMQLSSAAQAANELGKIANKINIKHNGMLFILANVFLLWDCECAISLEKWKKKYARSIEQCFIALGEFESLLSLSHLPNICSHTCLPTFSDNNNIIEAQEIGHPLLSDEIRVNNNFSCINNIFIISGSNMSGKTTFLRTLGINMILARAGSFVCAAQMKLPLVKIMTSMRIADNLSEGVSTFYAELKRVKGIIDLAAKESNMLFLIDEIFRGTNSVDRLSGATAVITKLNELGVIGMISTHDLELCTLAEHHSRIKNYNFSEHYQNKQIHFDYKIRSGKSNTTNAKYLMEMIGIFSDCEIGRVKDNLANS